MLHLKVTAPAARLRTLRAALGMTQPELAAAIGSSAITVWRAEAGRGNLETAETLVAKTEILARERGL